MTRKWMLEKTWTLRSAAALLATAPVEKEAAIPRRQAGRFRTGCHHRGPGRGGTRVTLVVVR